MCMLVRFEFSCPLRVDLRPDWCPDEDTFFSHGDVRQMLNSTDDLSRWKLTSAQQREMEVDFGQYSDGLEFEFGSLGVVLPHHVAAKFRKEFAEGVVRGRMRGCTMHNASPKRAKHGHKGVEPDDLVWWANQGCTENVGKNANRRRTHQVVGSTLYCRDGYAPTPAPTLANQICIIARYALRKPA